nr:PAS domain S-box protein [Nitrospirota bacterium]
MSNESSRPTDPSAFPPRPPAPGPGRRAELLLIQILVAIVLSYHLLFSEETHGLYALKEWIVLGLLLLVAGVMAFPGKVWESSWFVGSLVMADTAVTSSLIYFSPDASSGFHVTFFLIILVAASAPSLQQAFGLSTLLCVGYAGLLYLGPLQVRALSVSELLEVPVLLVMAVFYGVSADTVRRLHRKTEQMAEESEQTFRALVESAKDAIVQADSQGILIWWNKAAQTLFAYDEQEMLGRPVALLMPERYRARHTDGLERFARTGQGRALGRTFEYEGLKKDGTEFPLELSLVAWRVKGRMFFSGILRDLSERKQVEALVRHKEAELRQRQKMEALGRLAAEVAHDFNQLLQVIQGSCQIGLKGRDGDDPLFKRLEAIKKASERGEAITRQLLVFGRNQPMQLRRVDLNQLVKDQVPIIQELLGPAIRVEPDLTPTVCPVLVDPGQFPQAIVNLAVNARDAMPTGGTLTITTAMDDHNAASGLAGLAGRPSVRLTIRDTGRGMDPGTCAHCFDPFFTTKGEGQGTGLGLATVQRIVEQNGGTIAVASEPRQGTTFTIALPRQESVEGPEETAVPMVMPRGDEVILVVDDDQDVRLLMQETLSELGYQVLETGSPENALLLAEQHPGRIHLLLTDVVMPEMNGRQLAERLALVRPDIKILYVSGYSGEILASHGLKQAAPPCIPKPFTIEELAVAVRRVLDQG